MQMSCSASRRYTYFPKNTWRRPEGNIEIMVRSTIPLSIDAVPRFILCVLGGAQNAFRREIGRQGRALDPLNPIIFGQFG